MCFVTKACSFTAVRGIRAKRQSNEILISTECCCFRCAAIVYPFSIIKHPLLAIDTIHLCGSIGIFDSGFEPLCCCHAPRMAFISLWKSCFVLQHSVNIQIDYLFNDCLYPTLHPSHTHNTHLKPVSCSCNGRFTSVAYVFASHPRAD